MSIILIGTTSMFLLVTFIITFMALYQKKVYRTKLENIKIKSEANKLATLASFQGQENERQRIAKDIHDDINGSLTVLNMKIDFLTLKVKNDKFLMKELGKMSEITNQSILSVRNISQNLMPYTLTKFGLGPSIEQLAKSISSPPNFITSITILGQPFELDNDTCLMLFRAIQEIFNNTIKHSKASNLEVILDWTDERKLHITIDDNGTGFDYKRTMSDIRTGIGLKNIESRLNLIDATCIIVSNNNGTKYIIELSSNKKVRTL